MHFVELCSFLICVLMLGYRSLKFEAIKRVLVTRLALKADVKWMCKFFDLECSHRSQTSTIRQAKNPCYLHL